MAGRRLSGIEELLLQWDWHLPEGYAPISLSDCPSRGCRELVLIVHGGKKTLKLNRDGRLHRLHPRTTGVREEEVPLDEVRDTPVRVLKL